MKSMAILGLLAVISGTSAALWNDLRITSGQDLSTSFLPLPRTAVEAWLGNWVGEGNLDTECEKGAFRGTRYTEADDDSIALLYDKNGVIAGIQAQIPHSEILKPENTFRFHKVPMFNNITIRGEQFFVLTAYFVNPATLCSESRTEADLSIDGTGTGLWFQNGPTADYLIEVSKDRATGWSKGWSHNNCWQAMGTHNFWQTERYDEDHQCDEIRPTFVLFDENTDQMLGFGFTIPGAVSLKRFESPPNAVISAIINPTPKCLTEMNDRVGAATMHIYFQEQPWLIGCAGN